MRWDPTEQNIKGKFRKEDKSLTGVEFGRGEPQPCVSPPDKPVYVLLPASPDYWHTVPCATGGCPVCWCHPPWWGGRGQNMVPAPRFSRLPGLPSQPTFLAPTSPTSSTKPDEASVSGKPLPFRALSLVKTANEALNLSKVWPLSWVLGPTSFHQQN